MKSKDFTLKELDALIDATKMQIEFYSHYVPYSTGWLIGRALVASLPKLQCRRCAKKGMEQMLKVYEREGEQ